MRSLTVGGPQPHVGTQVLEKSVEGGDEVLGVQGRGAGGEGGGVGRRKEQYNVLLPTLKSLALCLTRAQVRTLTHSSTLRS